MALNQIAVIFAEMRTLMIELRNETKELHRRMIEIRNKIASIEHHLCTTEVNLIKEENVAEFREERFKSRIGY